jgi:hypothetical protein
VHAWPQPRRAARSAGGRGRRAALAAREAHLADRFCDETRCFSVIGGALVHHDRTHMTTAFSATLGPFILRALDG